MGSTEVNTALAKRLRYLAPDTMDERNGYIRLAFGAFGQDAKSWSEVEPLALSVRKSALWMLIGLKRDVPPAEPPEEGDVPLGEGGPTLDAEIVQHVPPSSPPELILIEGYASRESVAALREWATALGQSDVLERELAHGGEDASGPIVTPWEWERCVSAVQQAFTLLGASLHDTPAGEEVP